MTTTFLILLVFGVVAGGLFNTAHPDSVPEAHAMKALCHISDNDRPLWLQLLDRQAVPNFRDNNDNVMVLYADCQFGLRANAKELFDRLKRDAKRPASSAAPLGQTLFPSVEKLAQILPIGAQTLLKLIKRGAFEHRLCPATGDTRVVRSSFDLWGKSLANQSMAKNLDANLSAGVVVATTKAELERATAEEKKQQLLSEARAAVKQRVDAGIAEVEARREQRMLERRARERT